MTSLFGNEIESFSHIHPGGYYNLSLAANSNSDEARMLFLSYHTGKNMNKIIQTAKLNKFNNIPITDKQSLLKQEIDKIFINVQQKHRFQGFIYKMFCVLIMIFFIFSVINNIFNASFFNTMILTFCWTTYPFVIFHTRHHFGGNLFIKNNSLLRISFDIFDNIFTIPAKQWLYQHELSHHMYPNSPTDYDVMNPFPLLRLINNYKHLKIHYLHQYQWIYGLILFLLNGLTFPLKNIVSNKEPKQVKGKTIDAMDGHWMCLLIYFIILIILPYHYNGIYALKLFIFANFVGSFITAVLFQVSHHTMDIRHDNKDILTIKSYDKWIKSQVEESMSWGGYIATLIFGGINFQIEHHIAPGILPIYYYFVHKELKDLFKKYDIKYVYYNNIFTVFYQYEKYIFNINKY